ncbi:hypothetical protein NE237_027094 [Protea cynaroides]|uniref:DYW domain-containing protein n=1 Tax=Protea cynaroides TaxID=273540 RepID=A0A9Q0GQM5_9MAGN|nr:hypothetical protein NE237_027094 [Protea cynaroides]
MTFTNPSLSSLSKVLEIKNCLIQGCRDFKVLKHLHARLLRFGLDQHNYFLNLFLRASMESRNPDHARLVFDQTREPNIFLWNSMIQGFVSNDCLGEAMEFYGLMRKEGLFPNNFTFPFVLKASARLCDLESGVKIHTHLLKGGFENDVFVKTSLLCLYAKCACLDGAHKLFDDMTDRNVVSCTAIITGYIGVGRFVEAVQVFQRMLEMNLRPDSFTLVRVLSACSQLGDIKTGDWVHKCIEDIGITMNVFVATALVDMYAKCGSMEKARSVFDGMLERDIVSWGAMIQGYAMNGLPKEAVEIFFQMQRENVKPDCFTMVGILSACARLGALELGQRVSCLIDKKEFHFNPVLGTALIDMYAKCGSFAQAWQVFQAMQERDIVVWNAVISGLALNGYVKAAFALFGQMEKSGIRPEGNTFIAILCGCSHAGLVDEGRRYFHSMNRIYSLTPRIEHYGCFVDLLGRAGLLEEAHHLIKDMPFQANAVVWGALLGGCRIHRDTHLAEHVLKRLIELEPWSSGNYVLLSNIYSTSGRWNDSAKLRLTMNERGIQKTPGCSWIEFDGVVHEFRVGDRSNPLSDKIYMKLDELSKQLKEAGYMPTTEFVLFDIEEEEKEYSLGFHSEKLAVAFGLICTKPKDVIRVVKNLRVCGDCHTAIKIISNITNREIIVRDTNRYHIFKNGSCSCKDYW